MNIKIICIKNASLNKADRSLNELVLTEEYTLFLQLEKF